MQMTKGMRSVPRDQRDWKASFVNESSSGRENESLMKGVEGVAGRGGCVLLRPVRILQRTELILSKHLPNHKVLRELKNVKDKLLQLDAVRAFGMNQVPGLVDAGDLLFRNVMLHFLLCTTGREKESGFRVRDSARNCNFFAL